MRIMLWLFILLGVTSCHAQKTNHTFGLVPLGCTFHRGFYYTHGINYQLEIGENSLFVSSDGTLFNDFDARKRRGSNVDQIPFLNHSVLAFGCEIFNQRKTFHSNKIQLLLGYQYFQHGTQDYSDFWYLDSLENNGVRVLSGFRTHSASIGTKWSTTKFKNSELEQNSPLARNSVEINYLLGLAVKLNVYDRYGDHQKRIEIANPFDLRRHGFHFSYKYERFLTKHTSLYTQLDLLYAPFINYIAKKEIAILRGGEGIKPFFPSVKIGLNLFKNPYLG